MENRLTAIFIAGILFVTLCILAPFPGGLLIYLTGSIDPSIIADSTVTIHSWIRITFFVALCIGFAYIVKLMAAPDGATSNIASQVEALAPDDPNMCGQDSMQDQSREWEEAGAIPAGLADL